MKALILAAGMGTRLSPITDERPKSMVPVNGKPILFKQIENLMENSVTDITVIAGYKADMLVASVAEAFPAVKVIVTDDYLNTNNMYSAYLGRASVADGPFLMMNADVYYDSSVLTALLACPHENAIVVDMGRYLEEAMKVVEEGGRLTEIAKTIPPERALGSSIDVYKFSTEGGAAFFRRCAEYIEVKKELKKWSEVALADALADVEFHACPLSGRWFEIDNHDDLAQAEALFTE